VVYKNLLIQLKGLKHFLLWLIKFISINLFDYQKLNHRISYFREELKVYKFKQPDSIILQYSFDCPTRIISKF